MNEAQDLIPLVLTFAFAAWAGVVGWIGKAVIHRIDKMHDSVVELDSEMQRWVVQTEGRLAALEEWKKLK